MLTSKAFYDKIDEYLNNGIVSKKDGIYYLDGNSIEFRNNCIYINDVKKKIEVNIHERSYLDYLDKKEFIFKEQIIFLSKIDYLDWKAKKSFSPLLYKIEEVMK